MWGAEILGPFGQVGADRQDEVGAPGDEPLEPVPHQGGQAPPDGEVVEGDDQPRASAAASSQGQGGQGPGSQAVGVKDVGAPAQPTQPGHGQSVVGAGAGTDLEHLGAGWIDIQSV